MTQPVDPRSLQRSVQWLHARFGVWPVRVAVPGVLRPYRVCVMTFASDLLFSETAKSPTAREVEIGGSDSAKWRYQLEGELLSSAFQPLQAGERCNDTVTEKNCVPGLIVLYEASQLTSSFPAAVAQWPRLGCVTLTGLSPEYRTHVGRVPAAAIARLRKAPTELHRSGWALPGVFDELPLGLVYYDLAPLSAGWRYITRTTEGKAESYDAARATVQNVCAGETVH